MARQYIATPATAAGALVEVTTSTALKTLLQVNVPANSEIRVVGWGCSFDGVSGTDAPGNLYLGHGDVAASGGTSLTPATWGEQIETIASDCIGGAALTAYFPTSTEGTIASWTMLDPQQVHPQSGYSMWFPSDARPRVGSTAARFLRIRAQFAVAVNGVPWVIWQE
jgi:hypothetical protein